MTARSAQLRVPASSLGALSKLESGGQGTVYELSGGTPALSALPYSDLVYKEYDQSARVELDPDALDDMARYAAQLTPGREGLGDRLAWPLATVEQEGTVSGFLMRRAPQQFVVRLHLLNTEKQKLAEAQLLLNDEQYLANRQLPVHDRWRLQFLRDTADTLAQLHRYGIAVGDLSPKNLLASFSTRPYCFFLDCDTMRMIGRSALPQVDTPGWEIHKGKERATPASDAYKFALLAIRLFARDQDSKDITALSAMYPPLGQLAQRGISPDPSARPTPADWLPALDAATPLATTTLPWEQIRSRAGGATPPRPAGPHRVPPSPPPALPSPRIPAPAKNYSGTFGLALAVLVGLVIVLTQSSDASLLREEPSAAPGTTSAESILADPAASYAELGWQLTVDDAEIRSNIAETWVPQLASARPGLVVDGVTFDYTHILREHWGLRQQYPEARLVWSGDWSSFTSPDFFVTVLAIPFGAAEEANGWCDQQGIDRDHCFAKLLSQVTGSDGSTRHR